MIHWIILYLAIGFLIAAKAVTLIDEAPTWVKITCFFLDVLFWPFHLLIALIIVLTNKR